MTKSAFVLFTLECWCALYTTISKNVTVVSTFDCVGSFRQRRLYRFTLFLLDEVGNKEKGQGFAQYAQACH